MEQNREKSFYKDFLTLGAGTLIYMLIGFIGTPVLTRLVDPVDYGQMSLLTVYSNIGLMVCGLGLDQALLRYFYRDDIRYQRKLVFTCCGFPLLAAAWIGLLMILAYAAGFRWIPFTELILLEIHVVVLLLHRFATLLLRLRTHTKTYSMVNMIQKTSYILLTAVLILVVKDRHFMILAVSTILSTLLAALIAIFRERDIWHLPARRYQFPLRKSELLQYGVPIMLSSSITIVFNALDKLFIQHFCTLTDVGIYASAMHLIAIFSVVRTAFCALWMPAAVAHFADNPEDTEFYQKGNTFISILMLAFGAGVILCKDLFVLLLGSKYQAASQIVPFLLFEPILYTVSETTATGIVVQKKSKYQVFVASGACLANFIGNWILTPAMGPQGAALSTGLSYIVFFILRTHFANKVFYVNYGLKRFFTAIILLLVFAFYASTHYFSMVQVAMFAGIMLLMAFMYRKDLVDAVRYGTGAFQKTHRLQSP